MGLVCSQTGANQVAPHQVRATTPIARNAPGGLINRKTKSLGTEQGNSRETIQQVPINPCPAAMVDIHVDARLLRLSKNTKVMGLYSELFRNPIVAVNINVTCTNKFKTDILSQPTINWGTLTVMNQVPKELPSVLCCGTTVIHAVLEGACPVKSGITLYGTVNGKKMEYRTTVENDVPYVVDPIIMADALQLLQDQLQEEGKICKGHKEGDGSRNLSIDTGYHTSNNARTTKYAPSTPRLNAAVINKPVSEDKELGDEKEVNPTMKRKDTPAATLQAAKPRKTSSLRNRIEASVFLEEDEETEDETTLPRRISTCLSMSRYGRMSRMSRRYSRSSLTGASDSSLMVNPPGRARGLQTRMSRKKRDRRRSQSSGILEYRYNMRPMTISDVETSTVESERLPSWSSVDGTWSENSELQDRGLSCELSPINKSLWGSKTEKHDVAATDTSSKGASSDEKKVSQCSNSYELKNTPTLTSDTSRTCPGVVRHTSGMQPIRERRPTPVVHNFQMGPKLSRRLSRKNSVIVEEEDPGEETETDCSCSDTGGRGRRLSNISRLTLRRKRFSKRRIIYNNLLRISKYGNMGTSSGQGHPSLAEEDEGTGGGNVHEGKGADQIHRKLTKETGEP